MNKIICIFISILVLVYLYFNNFEENFYGDWTVSKRGEISEYEDISSKKKEKELKEKKEKEELRIQEVKKKERQLENELKVKTVDNQMLISSMTTNFLLPLTF